MRTLDATQVRRGLPWTKLVEALRAGFRQGCEVPQRHHHAVAVPGEADASLLLMPAWTIGGQLGVKLVNVFPGNAARGLASVQATYVLSDARDGRVIAILDGDALTVRRTAAASALAADYLARADAQHLLMVGTGNLAPNLIAAHASVRPIRRVSIWGRSLEKAQALARAVTTDSVDVAAVDDLSAAAGQADIISCATLATAPLIDGAWLKPGVHLDLVGAFRPEMREADDTAVRRATVFVDTRAGAMAEAGDIVQPLNNGTIAAADVVADLADLTAGRHRGRTSDDEVTLFKSVGTALEDLVAAGLALKSEAADGGVGRSGPA